MQNSSLALQPIAVALLCVTLQSADLFLEAALPGERIAGAALSRDGSIFTWGSSLTAWTLPRLERKHLAAGPFGEGGCLTDLDGDGQAEFVTVRGSGLGDLVWLRPPDWRAEVIDRGVETHDCLEAVLFGRRGILIIHRGAQVRFYQRAAAGKWTSRDIYSIYTPSYQGGLALADVDGDGRTDIYCGNYWIRAPARFELAWRLFAINTWFENPESATMRLALLPDGTLAAAQAHETSGRVAVFRKPRNPREQWPFEQSREFDRPHALAWWSGGLLIGHRHGIHHTRSGRIASGAGVVAILPLDDNAFAAVGAGEIAVWRQRSSRK